MFIGALHAGTTPERISAQRPKLSSALTALIYVDGRYLLLIHCYMLRSLRMIEDCRERPSYYVPTRRKRSDDFDPWFSVKTFSPETLACLDMLVPRELTRVCSLALLDHAVDPQLRGTIVAITSASGMAGLHFL